MKKFSSTLCSLGFPSCFIHPGEAMHGDLGLISINDILFVSSTSGKTREILELVDLAKKNGLSKVIAITSHPDSKLRSKADIILDMGIIKEAGNLGLAPTSSILVILSITDSLAIVASEEKGITKEDYGKFHHRGYLGQIARGDNIIY
jgi:arabinose-5-phosphate isomerase